MNNYYRITAYHPKENISAIFDSNGRFEKLWQFSAYLIQKGFKIIEVGDKDKFGYGDMTETEYDNNRIILRACCRGLPKTFDNTVSVGNKKYFVKMN